MVSSLSPNDRQYLQRAVEIGREGWGRVHPNPMVGCVIVRDGEVIAEGWHEVLGGPHAEANALRKAGVRARGATAYVSLEPCNHFGRTPPCSAALSEAGVSRVIYGAADPGGVSAGGGNALRAGGMDVIGPVLSAGEARRENPAFFFNHERGTTYVALKLAHTLDGRIAEATGRRTSISGPEARIETHRLRAGFDGVIVGSETVMVDDPLLTVREGVPVGKQPTRIILDTRARTTPEAHLFDDVPGIPLVIFTGEDAPEASVARLEGAGATVHRVAKDPEGVSLEAVFRVCWDTGIRSLLCEGGGRLASQLIRGGFARRLYLFVAPFVLGERGVPAFPG
ncbi:MAG: bifunctional diaminohydroxyphosphoribosylaminopyrimidine deaminase/5-amino-6-(5-phosphoribosylamino)uracil reductase RibD, partial [Longimicrobiales bacterium]|nr:bifunctional diaminohydroxyphosphoribosylaminopyrimidine deaminase/5-amino-6-(5-phosphoribosylamino)uracil reductase RibD [Longimicrobiales bacterium]